MQELVETLLDCVNDKHSLARPALYLYSGHDATIMPLSGKNSKKIKLSFARPLGVFRTYRLNHQLNYVKYVR